MHIDPSSLSPNIAGLLASTTNGAVSAQGGGKSGKNWPTDIVAFSAKSQGLGKLGAMLSRLSAAVRSIDATPDALKAVRSEIKGIEASIEKTLDGRSGSGGFQTEWVSNAVSSYRISQLDLAPGEELEIDVRVTQSARQGGMYLSLGGTSLDLGGAGQVSSTFTIRIGGAINSMDLSFASGQTMAQIAAAINTFSETTGVEASAMSSGSNGGVLLRSSDLGSAEFVSVQVVNDGSIGTGDSIGIYDLSAEDADLVSSASHIDFDSVYAFNGVDRNGQDVAGRINNVWATGIGTRLYATMPQFAVSINLHAGDLQPGLDGNAQNLGRFLAMRFAGVERDQDQAGGTGGDAGWPEGP